MVAATGTCCKGKVPACKCDGGVGYTRIANKGARD